MIKIPLQLKLGFYSLSSLNHIYQQIIKRSIMPLNSQVQEKYHKNDFGTEFRFLSKKNN